MSALEVQNLSHFEGETRILSGIHFQLEGGRILGLVGPNGSGKSTLLQVLSGLRGSPAQVEVDGTPLSELSQRERASRIAYVGDDCTSEFMLTAEETVLIGGYALGNEHASELVLKALHQKMRETGCFDVRRRYLDQLSGGERQRVALARALFQGAKILCLDESFSKLDMHHQVKMGALIRQLAAGGRTILLVSHDLNFTAQWSDQVLLLARGTQVAMGNTLSTLNLENLQKLYPDARIEIDQSRSRPRIHFTSSGE